MPNLKMYNFISLFLISFKFLPDITRYYFYLQGRCECYFENSKKCSFEDLGPIKNPKF